ncbi:MAG: RlmE family RNA methyltransferase [Methanobrevibacter sp.]|jgi:23S rRNA (uridine2552-2'-O)-methyltransferase|nr:RlmE family RNA methyltransferase [Candidatus Methanoflexus mossambicus]
MGNKWQVKKKNDPYYKRAKSENYRSRASYKLSQINKKYKIIKTSNKVLDLGAAPGGWSQIALEKVDEDGLVVAVDLNKIKPFEEDNFIFIRGDFTTDQTKEKIVNALDIKADTIISDAAPSTTGIKNLDHLRSIDLAENVLEICDFALKENGNLLIKVFQGEEYKNLLDKIKKKFKSLKTNKPPSSRNRSDEMYVIGLKFKG